MTDDAQSRSTEGEAARRRMRLLILGVGVAAVLFAFMWLLLPAWDFLVEPVAPDVRDEIAHAIEAATDPAEQARLRLELAALEQEDAARRTSLRGTIAQIGTAVLAGSAAAWGAVAAWRQLQDNQLQAEAAQQNTNKQLRLAREQLEDNRQQAEAVRKDTNEQLRLARDAQLAERFTRAVDQLGSDNLDVRLGGIYGLERIASDSETDLPTVVEVLAAFVRSHSSRPRETRDITSSNRPGLDGVETLSSRAEDVQAALTVLGRIQKPWSTRVNLTGAQLEGAEFNRGHFERAVLLWAQLNRARFLEAHFEGAYFGSAHLEGAHLGLSHLEGAYFGHAHLEGADFRYAHLEGANFRRARATSKTHWPDDFNAEAEGIVFVDRDDSSDKPEPNGGD